MKKLLCLAVIAAYVYQVKHPSASPESFARWNKERQEAEQRVKNETVTYQAYADDAPSSCPRAAAFRQAQLCLHLNQLEIAKREAIHVLQQKPGALTAREAWQLSYYSEAHNPLESESP